MNVYNEPLNLKCFHILCKKCVDTLKDKLEQLECPFCKKISTTKDLSVNLGMTKLIDQCKVIERSNVRCNTHLDYYLDYWCWDCEQPICHACTKDLLHKNDYIMPFESEEGIQVVQMFYQRLDKLSNEMFERLNRLENRKQYLKDSLRLINRDHFQRVRDYLKVTYSNIVDKKLEDIKKQLQDSEEYNQKVCNDSLKVIENQKSNLETKVNDIFDIQVQDRSFNRTKIAVLSFLPKLEKYNLEIPPTPTLSVNDICIYKYCEIEGSTDQDPSEPTQNRIHFYKFSASHRFIQNKQRNIQSPTTIYFIETVLVTGVGYVGWLSASRVRSDTKVLLTQIPSQIVENPFGLKIIGSGVCVFIFLLQSKEYYIYTTNNGLQKSQLNYEVINVIYSNVTLDECIYVIYKITGSNEFCFDQIDCRSNSLVQQGTRFSEYTGSGDISNVNFKSALELIYLIPKNETDLNIEVRIFNTQLQCNYPTSHPIYIPDVNDIFSFCYVPSILPFDSDLGWIFFTTINSFFKFNLSSNYIEEITIPPEHAPNLQISQGFMVFDGGDNIYFLASNYMLSYNIFQNTWEATRLNYLPIFAGVYLTSQNPWFSQNKQVVYNKINSKYPKEQLIQYQMNQNRSKSSIASSTNGHPHHHGNVTVENSHCHTNNEYVNDRIKVKSEPNDSFRYGPIGHDETADQDWANPCSLAVTDGILVSFFSSAY
ncbi:colossin A [Tieghemostelium lacteum]|uniref:Colossin A n=1 Tax=Tieghemostelium lacteum TaxID=361077 RepID=A0A151ZCH9_TIELA|nr:colossin A [Tieghemostelium lacteum]|eukprot:KYQ91656.1 colossin A [Tieghemostelium lacteum]